MPSSAAKFHLPAIQVAGVRNVPEAEMLMAAGVDLIGIPLRLDVHAADVTDEEARAIFDVVSAPHLGVLITYLSDPKAVVDLTGFLGVNIVQLHGPVASAQLSDLRRRAPELLVIKSLVVGKTPVSDVLSRETAWSPWVDAFITDTYDASTGASGATGKTHDWSVSREIVSRSTKPVILAGGLNADNVGDAIRAVKPAGVDVHTGVEDARGDKDSAKVAAFVREARAAFGSLKMKVEG